MNVKKFIILNKLSGFFCQKNNLNTSIVYYKAYTNRSISRALTRTELSEGPDYSFIDGRPIPLSIAQRKRVILQKTLVSDALQLSKEIDFALDRFNKMNEEERAARQKDIESKFKKKGA